MPIVLYNAKTRLPEPVPENQQADAIISGTHGLPSDEMVRLVAPDNRVFRVPGDKVREALQEGWSLETDQQAALRNAIEDSSAGEVFASKAANQAAFGLPDLIKNKITADTIASMPQDKQEAAKQKLALQQSQENAVDDAHSKAALAGNIAGFGSSLFTGGALFDTGNTIGKAVEDGVLQGAQAGLGSVGGRIAAKAAGTAAEGAVIASPQAMTEASLGDPEEAAETLLWGGGVGGMLGIGGSALSESAQALRKAMSEGLASNPVDQLANGLSLKAVGMQKSQLKKLGASGRARVLDAIQEEDLLHGSREDVAERIKAMHSESGNAVQSSIAKLDDLLEQKPELKQDAFYPSEVAQRIRDELGSPAFDTPSGASEGKALEDIAQSVEQYAKQPGPISFSKAQEMKRELFEKFPLSKIDPSRKELLEQRAYGIFKDEMEKAADRVASAAGDDSGIVDEYIKQKKRFRNASDLMKGVENEEAAKLGNRTFGLTDFIHGGTVGSGVGHLLAPALGPLGYPIGVVASVVAKHWAEDRGLVMAGRFLKRVAEKDPMNFGLITAATANQGLQDTLAKIPNVLKRMALNESPQKLAKNEDPIKQLLGSESNGLSNDQQFDRVQQKLAQIVSDPYTMAENTAALAGIVSQTGAPNIGSAYNDKLLQAVQYLYANLPKPITPPAPFTNSKFKPTPAQKSEFKQKAQVVLNPMSVIHELERGTLTQNHMHALNAIYPKIARKFVDNIVAYGEAGGAKDMPYHKRIKLSLLIGKPLDPSLTPQRIADYQSVFSGNSSPQGGMGKGMGGPKAHFKNLPTLATETLNVSEDRAKDA